MTARSVRLSIALNTMEIAMRDAMIGSMRVRFYDRGGSGDRYTMVYMDESRLDHSGKRLFSCFGMNETPAHPCYGIGMHSDCMIGPHLGKRIRFDQLPEECQKTVRRLAELTD